MWYTNKIFGSVENRYDYEAMNHLCFNVPYWPAIILHEVYDLPWRYGTDGIHWQGIESNHLFCPAGSRGFSSPLTNTLTCLHSNLSLRLYLSWREKKTKLNLLPGQGPSSQSWLSKGSPIHFPPGPGGGLSHRRVLIAVPGPHDSLQELQGLHSPQPPLTTKVKETRNDLYCKHYYFFILQWEIQSLATWSLHEWLFRFSFLMLFTIFAPQFDWLVDKCQKKLFCCVGGKVKYEYLVLSKELIKVKLPLWKTWKADVSSVSPSSELTFLTLELPLCISPVLSSSNIVYFDFANLLC